MHPNLRRYLELGRCGKRAYREHRRNGKTPDEAYQEVIDSITGKIWSVRKEVKLS